MQLLGAGDCMFAFRAVVVLMARELAPGETVFLWEALMAAGDHMVEPEYDAPSEAGKGTRAEERGEGRANENENGDGGGGGGGEDAPGARGGGAGGGGGSGGADRGRVFRPEDGAGGGRMFLHVVAAAFLHARHVVFGCHEFDDLLYAAHHAVPSSLRDGGTAALLASARRLMAVPSPHPTLR